MKCDFHALGKNEYGKWEMNLLKGRPLKRVKIVFYGLQRDKGYLVIGLA